MAATVRAVTTGSHDTGTVTVALPAGTVAGDLLVAICFRDEGAGTSAWTGNPFTLLGQLNAGSSATTGGRIQVWTRTATGSDPSTFSYTDSSGNSAGAVSLFAISGAGTPTMATQNNTTSSTSMQAPTIPTPGQDPLLLCAWDARTAGSTRTITVPGTMAAAAQVSPPSNWIVTRAASEQLSGTGATGTRTATLNTAATSLAVSVAVPSTGPTTVSSSDSATSSDSFAANAAITSADTATASDAATVGATLPTVADATSSASDSFSVEQITAKSFADSATTADAFAAPVAAVTSADAATATDTASVARFSTVADSASSSDTFTPGPRFDDVATASDAFQIIVIPDAPQTVAPAGGRSANYELLVVARVPQAAGPPALLEIEQISWKSLKYFDALSTPQGLTATCPEASLSPAVVQRMRGLDRFATELQLQRNGAVVFAGPYRTWRRTGTDVEIAADGLLAYLLRMKLLQDWRFDQVDQFSIVKQWLDDWQTALQYGHYGIDTSTVGTSGKLRDGTYERVDTKRILTFAQELGARENGFDIEVDPVTRKLVLWYPGKGTDRSSGGDAIIFDDSNISSPDVMCSAAPDDLASHAFGVSTSAGSDTALTSFFYDPILAAAYGAGVVTQSWSDVSVQGTLDDHTLALLRSHNKPLMIPGPSIRVTEDADLNAYGEGDTVAFDMDPSRLGIDGAFRVRKRTVNVAETGVESVDLEFV